MVIPAETSPEKNRPGWRPIRNLGHGGKVEDHIERMFLTRDSMPAPVANIQFKNAAPLAQMF